MLTQTLRLTFKLSTALCICSIGLAACQPAANSSNAQSSNGKTTAAMPEAAPKARQAPIAQTQYGPVQGFVEDATLVFKGIRYGADTATTRFAPPAAPEPWTEPQMATAFGPSAPQPIRGNLSLFSSWAVAPNPGQSEDCLFLNVWTPALNAAQRPVMVWLHGGGFGSGSGSANAYDGVRLTERGDVVVVTVNHRLNVFGYTYLDDYGEQFSGSGNAGMLDLVAALVWVRDNIANFGGDPNNVTIFGESGGGWKVSTLMAMDDAQGLFHRAIVQSGPGLTLMPAAEAAQASAALVAELGLDGDSINKITELTTAEIAAAALATVSKGIPVGARPVVDGVVYKRHPFVPAAPAQSKQIPLMIGSTQTEMSLLAGAANRELFALTWDTLPAALSAAIEGVDAAQVIAGYRELHPDIDPPNLFFEATTDNSTFGRGSFELADLKVQQGGAPVYQYYFTWRTPVEDGIWGATHALDIGFAFDNVAKSASMSGTGAEQQALADVMSEAWIAFARTGNPNHPGMPEWQPYNVTERPTMIFANAPHMENDPRGAERKIIDAAL